MHDNVFGNMMVINMPGMDNPRYDPNSMFGRLFLISGLPRKIPGIIYTGNHKIEQLKLLKHNFFDIDYINKKGLHIYLWEPLCIYRSNFEGYNQGFYYEFDNNILDDEYRAYELDSILEYVKQHNRV